MKIVVTGANGQLAFDLKKLLLKRKHTYIGYDRVHMDVTDQQKVYQTIMLEKPDIVIHCAAFTNVNKAETLPEYTYLVNCTGTENVAIAAENVGAKLVYISTDYVFDGLKMDPYEETDIPNPLNVYGRSKWVGELIVKRHHSRYFIIRTSWLYGIRGDNFVIKILSSAKLNRTIQVVNDQLGNPTYSLDLAARIIDVMESERYGIYHISNSGSCTWYEFTKKIVELMDYQVIVNPVKSSQFPSHAKRPAYSVLSNKLLDENHFKSMRRWDEALEEFLLINKNLYPGDGEGDS